jgi:hypothetical protein
MLRSHGSVLIALLLAACSGTDVAQQSSGEPEGMILVYPAKDGTDHTVGRMHNKALAWVLADLQSAKRRLGSAWSPAELSSEAARSEARFLKHHPSVDQVTFYRIKNDKLAGRIMAAPAELDPASTAAVHSIEVASTLYWTTMGSEWSRLVDGAQFTSLRRDEIFDRIVKADIYGGVAGWIAGGPSGIIPGAIACSLAEAIIIIVEQMFSPGVSL